MTADPQTTLQDALGYRFQDPDWLIKALTHPSYRHEQRDINRDNQRLEFLGDAVLGMLCADWLFRRFREKPEGELTRLRSSLTNSRSLARIAHSLDLGAHLFLGRGEEISGGRTRPSNQADALEAIFGAAYLDGGMAAVTAVFQRLYGPVMEECLQQPGTDNPKGVLQELAQDRWKTTPRYRMVTETGPAHDKSFTVEVSVNEEALGRGTGPSKREAEIRAAEQAIRTFPSA